MEPIQPQQETDSEVQQQMQDLTLRVDEQLNKQTEQNERMMVQFEQLLHRLTPPPPLKSPEDTLLTPGETSRASEQAPIPTPPPPPPPVEYRLPAVPQITKLKGRENFKTWVFDITQHAHTYGVWEALIQPYPHLNEQQKHFAFALISFNCVSSIKSTLTQYRTAHSAWQYLNEKYTTQNIAQVVQHVQELTYLNYNKFNSIESFQQKVLAISQSIQDYANSASDAYHVTISALTHLIPRGNHLT